MSEPSHIQTQRAQAIKRFCDELHDDVSDLFELMLEGTDEEEKQHIEMIINKLQELNLDR